MTNNCEAQPWGYEVLGAKHNRLLGSESLSVLELPRLNLPQKASPGKLKVPPDIFAARVSDS